jgi:serine protease Do
MSERCSDVCRIGLLGLGLLACAAGITTTVSLAVAGNSGHKKLPGLANSAQVAVAQRGQRAYDTCGWIGVRVTPMTAAFADSLGMAVPYGAIFATPQLGSPAAQAGIEAGDVVTAINGSPLGHARDFAPLISTMAPNSSVDLDTMRGSLAINVTLTVASIKCHSLAAADDSGSTNVPERANSAEVNVAKHGQSAYDTCGWIGVRVTGMTAAAPYGAILAKPQPDSPAAKAGIKAGDVVTSINSAPLGHARDFAQLTTMMAPGTSLYLSTLRNGKARSVNLTLGSIKCQLYCSTNSICLPGPVLQTSNSHAAAIAGATWRIK